MNKENMTITLHLENRPMDEIKKVIEFVESLESYDDIWNDVFYIDNDGKEKIHVMITYYDDINDIQIDDMY